MFVQNVYEVVGVFAAFALLFVVIPFMIMGFKLTTKDLFYNVFACITTSCFFIILLVYFLSACNILSRFTLIVGIILLISIILFLVYRDRTKKQINETIDFFYLYLKGIHKIRFLMKAVFKTVVMKLWSFVCEVFSQPLSLICFIGGTAGAAYVRGYHAVTQMFFGLSDVYVQTGWTAQMISGEIFPDGVYPFGMHCIIATLSQVFNINILVVMRAGGVLIGMLVVWALYMLTTRLFKSKAAIGIAFLIYAIAPVIDAGSYYRQGHALPQELAMAFLFPTVAFFYEYMKTKKISHLIFASMALTLIIACHFYVAVVAVFLVGMFFLVNLRDMIKSKVLGKIIIAGVLSIVFSAGPLLAYNVIGGVQWEGSIHWALNVMGIEEEKVPEDAEESNEESPPPEEAPEVAKEPLSVKLKRITTVVGDVNLFYVHLISCVVTGIYAMLLLILKKSVYYARFLLAICLYCLSLVLVAAMPTLGLPEIIQQVRVHIFYFYNIGFVLMFIPEIVLSLLQSLGRVKYLNIALSYILLLGFSFYIARAGTQNPGFYSQVQYNGALESYYKIATEFERFKWTIVSPVDEVCLTRNYGWHYELSDFLYELAERKDIFIPGDDVFFFIEKRPIKPNRVRYPASNPEFAPEEPINMDDASKDILEIQEKISLLSAIYTSYEYRRVVMSKAYYWIQEYKKYFPDELTVFYEDDDMVVYHLVQRDPYSLNNFLIEYGYN